MKEQTKITEEQLIDLAEKIADCLCDNQINAEVYYAFDHPHYAQGIYVDINRGDWKHDHLRSQGLIEKNFGLQQTSSEITFDDGSDYYGCIHFFAYPQPKREMTFTHIPDALINNM